MEVREKKDGSPLMMANCELLARADSIRNQDTDLGL